MLQKLFGARKPKFSLGRQVAPKFNPTPVEEERSSPLRIIHAGGRVEQYYMAIPAARIIEKYPSFSLTRPDVFRRPWDAIVKPEEILIPGQKYFIVPRQTVKKLRRQIKRHSGIFNPKSSIDASAEMDSQNGDSFSSNSFLARTEGKKSGIMIKSKNKTKSGNRRVRFFGIDTKQNSGSVSSEHSTIAAESVEKSPNPRADRRKRRAQAIVQWQPSLTSIKENNIAFE